MCVSPWRTEHWLWSWAVAQGPRPRPTKGFWPLRDPPVQLSAPKPGVFGNHRIYWL